MSRRTLGIIGTGALGCSIGLRARDNGCRVLGYDIDSSRLEEARAIEAIDAPASRDSLYVDAEILVLAAPIDATLNELTLLCSAPPVADLIIDIASVKAPIADAARTLAQFVGTHPMAGTERSGPTAANARMFAGRTWAYVPSGNHVLDDSACVLIRSLDANPFAIDAQQHDKLLARTSHLPQLFASVFAASLAKGTDNEVCADLCGPAARELQRLGRSRLDMWEAIFRCNAGNIAAEARRLAGALTAVADATASGDLTLLRETFGLTSAAWSEPL
ncbi:MAG: prephenate dehydrogenase/arogenate dehydrogenase family protein [Candidatus Baltobacteraceae bacterium]